MKIEARAGEISSGKKKGWSSMYISECVFVYFTLCAGVLVFLWVSERMCMRMRCWYCYCCWWCCCWWWWWRWWWWYWYVCVCVCGELHIYRCILFSVHKACPNIDIAWYMYNFGNKGRQNESDTIDNDESWSEMKQAIYCENMLM